jgi:hypothetical protein
MQLTPQTPTNTNITTTPPSRYNKPWDDSDVIFQVEDEEFHCHHVVLKLNSPIFRAMFNGSFKEEKGTPVQLPGKEKQSFQIFLDFMYPMPPGYEASTERDVLTRVLGYCEEYQTNCVKVHIDYVLFSKVYSVDSEASKLTLPLVMKDLQTSERYGLKETRKVALGKVVKLSHDMDISTYDETVYPDLTVEAKFEVLTGLLRSCFSSGFITKGYNTNKLVDSLSKEARKETA